MLREHPGNQLRKKSSQKARRSLCIVEVLWCNDLEWERGTVVWCSRDPLGNVVCTSGQKKLRGEGIGLIEDNLAP